MIRQLKVFDLGLTDFKNAWQFQKNIFHAVKSHELEFGLVLCRHHPVITSGRFARGENILAAQEELQAKGIEVVAVERAGDMTYHGPGQLISYPIFDLKLTKKDIHLFLRQLEEVILRLLSDLGIRATRNPGFTGVWVGERKIASIGIAIKGWISFHGLSLNVKKDDLENFRLIRPCGLDVEMVSVETILNREVGIEELKTRMIRHFQEVFEVSDADLIREVRQYDQGILAGIR